MRLRVGDRVIGVDASGINNGLRYGYIVGLTGTVIESEDGHGLVNVLWDGSRQDRMFSWRMKKIDPVPELDRGRPITMRDGSPVTVTAGDPERPFRATVRGLELSFDKHGRFYPHVESPIDLVNA